MLVLAAGCSRDPLEAGRVYDPVTAESGEVSTCIDGPIMGLVIDAGGHRWLQRSGLEGRTDGRLIGRLRIVRGGDDAVATFDSGDAHIEFGVRPGIVC